MSDTKNVSVEKWCSTKSRIQNHFILDATPLPIEKTTREFNEISSLADKSYL